jgi:DNA replication protein DnaC
MYNIGKTALKNGLKVKSILAGTLIDKLMKLQGFNYVEEIYKKVTELKGVDLLLIDDFGDVEKSLMWSSSNKSIILTEWDKFLRELLASRTKIVMTSNYDKENIGQVFGKSLCELIDRNFYAIQLTESIKEIRQYNVAKVFQKNIKRRKTSNES